MRKGATRARAVETLLDKADKAILRAAARAEGCESAGDPGDGGDTTIRLTPLYELEHRLDERNKS